MMKQKCHVLVTVATVIICDDYDVTKDELAALLRKLVASGEKTKSVKMRKWYLENMDFLFFFYGVLKRKFYILSFFELLYSDTPNH